MNLEGWLYRRDREENILSLVGQSQALHRRIDIIRHLFRREEAEQEIEEILRA